MDGENNGTPYIEMDDLGGKNHPYFRFNTHIFNSTPWKFNSEFSPENFVKGPNRKGSSSNHQFSGASC